MLSADDIETYFRWIGVRYSIREHPNQEQGWNKGEKEHGIWYNVTLRRAGKKDWKFPFGNSLNAKWNGEEPEISDILENQFICRYTTDSSFYDWCGDMGFDYHETGSKRAYNSSVTSSRRLNDFFSEEELDQLQSDEPLPVAPETSDMVTDYDRSLEESLIFKVNSRLLGYESTSPIIDYDIKILGGT